MARLTPATLRELADRVPVPEYDRGGVTAGVVHLGVGGFHRSHQALFHDDLLAAGPDQPALVVTRPDRPGGRGRKLTSPPVAETARALGLELEQPDSVNTPEFSARLRDAGIDEVVVCAFGALIKEPLLSDFAMLNVHPSLLPRWRGAAPIERAIMAGDAETGVAIMQLTAGLDSGPVALQEAEPIRPDDTFATLSARLEQRGADLLLRTLDERPPFVEQPEDGVTYAEKLGPEDRTLDLSRPAEVNERIVRALTPHVGARVALADGSFLGVLEARVGEDGGLELVRVQPPGGKPMAYADYVRGRGEPAFAPAQA